MRFTSNHIVFLFWFFIVACLSATSTMIFSESLLNDSLGGAAFFVSVIGLVCFGALLLLQQVLDICNP